MKKLSSLILLTIVSLTSQTLAQESSKTAAQAAEELRAQLKEVQTKEAELQARAKQLDEDLKPENIERSLAGVGSTKPEELRDLRRRQLTIEKKSITSQLAQLAARRARLEAAIVSADAAAYQQSAEIPPASLNQFGIMRYVTESHWLVGLFGGILAIAAVLALFVVVRRL